MKDHIHRTVSESITIQRSDGKDSITVTASRCRTSSAFAAISLDFNEKRVLDLGSDHLEDYQGAARAIGDLLRKMADEPCKIPVVV